MALSIKSICSKKNPKKVVKSHVLRTYTHQPEKEKLLKFTIMSPHATTFDQTDSSKSPRLAQNTYNPTISPTNI